jgi:hypothetical protein
MAGDTVLAQERSDRFSKGLSVASVLSCRQQCGGTNHSDRPPQQRMSCPMKFYDKCMSGEILAKELRSLGISIMFLRLGTAHSKKTPIFFVILSSAVPARLCGQRNTSCGRSPYLEIFLKLFMPKAAGVIAMNQSAWVSSRGFGP